MGRLFLLLVLCVPLLAQSGNLRVIILAVDEFHHPAKKDDDLNLDGFATSAESAVKEISGFFRSRYGVEAKVIHGESATTKAAIQTYLNTEYATPQLPSVTLFFVLSHGFGHLFPRGSNELFIATSDTDRSSYLGSGYEGTDFVRKLARVPARSSVFLFLDTCQSAAIDFGGINQILSEDLAGRRFMVMAATDGGAKAYNFNFSRALIDLWNSAKPEECEKDPDDIGAKVQQFLNQRKGTSPAQRAQVVFPFDGGFCIESFGRDRGLAMLYNPGKNPVRVAYREKLATRVASPRTVLPTKVFPLSLKPGDYVLTITEDIVTSQAPKERSLELRLTANHVEFRPVADPGASSAALQSLGAAQLSAAAIATRWGAEPSDVWQLSQAGRVTLARIGLEGEVPEAAKVYVSQFSQVDDSSALALNYAALGGVAVPVRYKYLKSKIISTNADPFPIAVLLGQSGDYDTANRLCLDFMQFQSASDQLVQCAAYNSVATATVGRARQTRRVLASYGKGSSAGIIEQALKQTDGTAIKFQALTGVYGLEHAVGAIEHVRGAVAAPILHAPQKK